MRPEYKEALRYVADRSVDMPGHFRGRVLVTMLAGKVRQVWIARLAALNHEFAPTDYEERSPTPERPTAFERIPWLNHWLTKMNRAVSSLFLYQPA